MSCRQTGNQRQKLGRRNGIIRLITLGNIGLFIGSCSWGFFKRILGVWRSFINRSSFEPFSNALGSHCNSGAN